MSRRTLKLDLPLPGGEVLRIQSLTPCGHCGELSSPDKAAEHLLICTGCPEELHRLASAALDLEAVEHEPEGSEATLAAARQLGIRIAEADMQKNPRVTREVLLDDVDGFGSEQKPWFHQAVRDAAITRWQELRRS